MADEKVFSDGYVDAIVIRQSQLTDPSAPLITEVNTHGINVSLALAWDGTTWPNNTDSDDLDDRSVKDSGNAQSRGDAQFEATLNFFYPKDRANTTDTFGKVRAFMKDAASRIPVYVITRLIQTTPNTITPLAGGDLVSVFQMITDVNADDTEGDDSVKYAITLLPQGGVWPYTQAVEAVKTAITVTAPDGLPTTAGAKKALRAVLNGKRVTNQVTWTSSNPAAATVSSNGVVVGVAPGTANITASHPAGTTSAAQAVTIA